MQANRNDRFKMDMVNGNLLPKMILFCLPLMASGILQLLYNSADLIVVSNFSSDPHALGAVGSTGSLIGLTVNLFMGFSVGTNVLCARYFAQKNEEGMQKAIHTSILLAFLSGLFLGTIGVLFAKEILSLMNNPIDLAVTYVRIYFIGLPLNLVYNFASAVLRGVGDTKRPLIFLSISGIINVLLNLFFVIVLDLSVAGVALATIISQAISAFLVIRCLRKEVGMIHFSFSKLAIHKSELKEIVRIGLPAGLQGSIFSISNVLIQSKINAFGATIINGNSAASNLEGFVYTSMNSVYHAALSFTSQNVGVKKYENIKRILLRALLLVSIIGIVMGGSFYLLSKPLLSIYTRVPEQIAVGQIRFNYIIMPYFIFGCVEVVCGVIRGMGYAVVPLLTSIIGICGLRILWIYLIFNPIALQNNFEKVTDLHLLYISYPISWVITLIAHFVCYIILRIRLVKKDASVYAV